MIGTGGGHGTTMSGGTATGAPSCNPTRWSQAMACIHCSESQQLGTQAPCSLYHGGRQCAAVLGCRGATACLRVVQGPGSAGRL